MKKVLSISICIPTYNRPDFLQQAVKSCLDQTVAPLEIIIGDDSPTEDTSALIRELIKTTDVKIRYFHNVPALGQALNVNDMFTKVEGKFTILLHDDDLLLPNALEDLHNCFLKNTEIDAAFGKQYFMSEAGVVDLKASEEINKVFYRSSEYEGTRLSPLEAGFLQQFPNDGYLIKSSVVKEIGYSDVALDACDLTSILQTTGHQLRQSPKALILMQDSYPIRWSTNWRYPLNLCYINPNG
jgi:glycosyltransferase involved in cell wall biosynthesis